MKTARAQLSDKIARGHFQLKTNTVGHAKSLLEHTTLTGWTIQTHFSMSPQALTGCLLTERPECIGNWCSVRIILIIWDTRCQLTQDFSPHIRCPNSAVISMASDLGTIVSVPACVRFEAVCVNVRDTSWRQIQCLSWWVWYLLQTCSPVLCCQWPWMPAPFASASPPAVACTGLCCLHTDQERKNLIRSWDNIIFARKHTDKKGPFCHNADEPGATIIHLFFRCFLLP